MNITIPDSTFKFLLDIKHNNTREWMQENRSRYLEMEEGLKKFYAEVEKELSKIDEISNLKIFRINRDIRFSPNKTPYNSHRSISLSRAGAHRRGGYYLRLEPGNSYMAGGFFDPNKEDLLRIRKEFDLDPSDIREILDAPDFKKTFHGFEQRNAVKSAPKGFGKDNPNIDLIKLKSFVVKHPFSDAEVMDTYFSQNLVTHFQMLRPFFDYMSNVLTTDLNGVSLLENE